MAEVDRLGQWANVAKIVAAVAVVITLVLGGGFFYSEIWNVSDLRYTILPTYDAKDMVFSGLIVENRGRAPVRDVDIILTDLEHDISLLHMPGLYGKQADTDWDPNNPRNGATVEMERLPEGSSLPIYLLTSSPITLGEGKTFAISSNRGKAKPSSERGRLITILSAAATAVNLAMVAAGGALLYRISRLQDKVKETQDKAEETLDKAEEIAELSLELTEVSKAVAKVSQEGSSLIHEVAETTVALSPETHPEIEQWQARLSALKGEMAKYEKSLSEKMMIIDSLKASVSDQ